MNAAPLACGLAVLAITGLAAAPAAAARKVAVFDFELVDTSLDGEMNGPRADEQQRIVEISTQLRQRLSGNNKVSMVDIGPVNDRAHAVNLQACGGCDANLAGTLGASLSITGTVQKVSNLILNMNIYVRDVASGRLVAAMTADMRGNTEESWSHTLDWLVRNRLTGTLDGLNE